MTREEESAATLLVFIDLDKDDTDLSDVNPISLIILQPYNKMAIGTFEAMAVPSLLCWTLKRVHGDSY